MKGIQVHKKEAIESIKNKDNIKIYDCGSFNLARHALPKDALYYISPQKDCNSIKTYYIESGTMRLLESSTLLTPGDMISCSELDSLAVLHFLTDGTILSHNFCEAPETSFDTRMKTLETLMGKIQEKDTYTMDHCQRVLQLVKHVGLALGYNSQALNNLTKAARFHDIGKIYIADEILNKPASLTDSEYTSIKEHVLLGKTVIEEAFGTDVFAIVAQHHERLDGSGYPNGLVKAEICQEAKIIAICDSFDAMTTDRVYKTGISVEEAFDELRSLSDTKYDRKLVEIFIEEYLKISHA